MSTERRLEFPGNHSRTFARSGSESLNNSRALATVIKPTSSALWRGFCFSHDAPSTLFQCFMDVSDRCSREVISRIIYIEVIPWIVHAFDCCLKKRIEKMGKDTSGRETLLQYFYLFDNFKKKERHFIGSISKTYLLSVETTLISFHILPAKCCKIYSEGESTAHWGVSDRKKFCLYFTNCTAANRKSKIEVFSMQLGKSCREIVHLHASTVCDYLKNKLYEII